VYIAKSHIKRKTGKSGEIMRLYLRTRNLCTFRYSLLPRY